MNIAVTTVANGFSTLTNANVADKRVQSGATSVTTTSSASSWNALGYTPASVTANGNRSYSLVFNSVNLTTTVSPGMRLRTTRTVAAPTQCTSLNGSTQYYSKSSPAGMTFTDDFVVSAWVKLSSYPSAAASIVSRYNGTSGWALFVDTTGQVFLRGYNAGASNFSYVITYQSVPLNRWVHITAQLDMSTFTATSTTSYVMLDGVDVPCSVARAGTNPTALIQAGDLEVGGANGAASFFPGKIAQVAVFNAKVTQATMQSYISQGLAGTETSLISAYSFNNVITDLNTSNANNLTANVSAVATNADSPFGGQADGTISSTLDYALITKTVFSTNTTLTVQVSEGCTIPTSGGVSALSYSTQKVPYLFPTQKTKWAIQWVLKASTLFAAGGTVNTWQSGPVNGNFSIIAPLGEWQATYDVNHYGDNGSNTNMQLFSSLSISNSSESDSYWSVWDMSGNTATPVFFGIQQSRTGALSVATATPYYLIGKVVSSVGTVGNHSLSTSNFSPSLITLDNAYL